MSLNDLAFKYGTDKRIRKHGYVLTYEELLKDRDIKNLLEIGVYNGGSHLMWLDYFPGATIYGIDIDSRRLNRAARRAENDSRLQLAEIDQSNYSQLKQWVGTKKFDIIIDDGSHMCSHQITSFDALWRSVVPGGVYVVEDSFTSYWKGHTQGYVDQDLTCVEYFKAMVDELNLLPMRSKINRGFIDFNLIKNHLNLSFIQATVESIQFRHGMIIVYKRRI